jgi:CDP-glucose 4,6-dehydratase
MVTHQLLSVFRGKRVIVTGDTGFKGSWLCVWLHQLGADVVGFALPPKRDNDHFNLLQLGRIIHHVEGDIRELPALQRVFEKFQPEFLFHLAAQSLVRYSYEEPKLTFDTNVAGSVNILECVRTTPSLRAAVYVTSDKCYRNKEWVWGYRENDELGGRDPYSASKAAAELVFSAYVDSYFSQREALGIASVRAGNVIGGGDWAADRIVPDSIKSLQRRQPVLLRNPLSTRPWQHVLEPLSGYLSLASKLYSDARGFSGSWNFGPRIESIRTVHDLAERIVACWGEGKVEAASQQSVPHEARLLQLNCDKAIQMLEWAPRWDFDHTVEVTVQWYRDITNGMAARQVTNRQIEQYMES